MSSSAITVVGLGPGRRETLTIEAIEILRVATHLYLYTDHPILDELRADLRSDVQVQVFPLGTDPAHIAETLLAARGEGALVYAVPGHPLSSDRSVTLLVEGAVARGLEVRIVAGLGLLESVASAMQLDPWAAAAQLMDAPNVVSDPDPVEEGLQELWTGPSSRLLNAQAPLLVGGIHDARILAAVARRLLGRYPPGHMVTLVCAARAMAQETVTRPLVSLDSAEQIGARAAYPAVLYVPPLAPLDDARAPNTLGYITARLRAPGGCPWDREQTHASLTPYMIEEAYEAIDAIERRDDADLVEELGDVLLQVVLHSQLAEEEGRFSLAEVAEAVNRKLVRRHPHVFGDVSVSGSSEVLHNWERIKRAEKGERRRSALDGIPLTLPALALAQTIGRKAAKLGFDWPDVEGTFAKVREELDEIHDARSDAERREEIGDLLYAVTSVCRHLGIDAEDALRAATRKFAQRFRRVEDYARERNLDLAALDISALDALWEEAKELLEISN